MRGEDYVPGGVMVDPVIGAAGDIDAAIIAKQTDAEF